ncbi:MAG: bifunctional UDP-N-acetylglucosamine diphosphorylase/glucosamine-1-phosphate N-acetyltransferase GlmU, partial [Thermodesulfobacteriota bacterium]
PIVCVVGHGAESVKEHFTDISYKGLSFCLQSPQLGTGHAVMCAANDLKKFKGDVLILSGDVPLLEESTLKGFIKFHQRRAKERPVLSLLTVMVKDPSGYGRVIRNSDGEVEAVIEDSDATIAEKKINEINCGIYIASSEFLFSNIKKLGTENKQKEYYLPDLITLARGKGKLVKALTHMDAGEVMGINNRVELAAAGTQMRERILNKLMLGGVSIIDPAATYIDSTVKVGADSVVYPGVHLAGKTAIASGVTIEEGVRVEDSTVGSGTRVRRHTLIESSKVGKNNIVGPQARLRPGTELKDDVHIGNFVEIKNCRIGRGTKANHLTYLGDAEIGAGVNIGAGAMTCNYDGVKKYRTIIMDGAFIGSDSQLIAPVTIGKNAYVGSGSTITKDVPAGSLALSRPEQVVVKGWVDRKGIKKG